MCTKSWRRVRCALSVLALAGVIGCAGQPKSHAGPEGLPDDVARALYERFPDAEIRSWTREKEDGKPIYDIEFARDGRAFEMDVFADGGIENWEEEVAEQDLPQAVRDAVARWRSDARIERAMRVHALRDGADRVDEYEVELALPGGADHELAVAPDGTILEG